MRDGYGKYTTSDLCGDDMAEMLDLLESRLAALRAGRSSAVRPAAVTDAAVQSQMRRVGLSAADFLTVFRVDPHLWEEWMAGKSSIPAWVEASLQILALLSPTARRSFLNRPGLQTYKTPAKTHPFSRIEEL